MPKINDQYDIGEAFEAIENELIASMIRNLRRHKQEEIDEKKQWSMWQAEQLEALEKYKKFNQKKYGQKFKDINKKIQSLISIARSDGEMSQEVAILEAIRKGFPAKRISKGATAEFFKLNERKLETLIKATMDDMKKAETAVLRMANDQYRKVIFNAQVYANTGAGTYEKAVDMATKDFLSAGLNCVEYVNGARHTLADYADMAIRTACKRAYLQGEGIKRQEWGIHTVIVNKRGNPCPKCLPFCGKVLIDDVWSGGSRQDGSYPLMSTAVAHGLYHPRCKDSHTTYFPGISTADDTWTEEELEAIGLKSRVEARQQYAERQEKRFGRLEEHSLDAENQKRYAAGRKEWKRIGTTLNQSKLNREYEDSKRKYQYPDTVIRSDIIDSNEFRKRIDILQESVKARRSIWQNAKGMLHHRTGTKYEDLAFIDSKTGKGIINKSFDKERHASPNRKMIDMLNGAEPNTIIAIHNHPGSSVPSLADLLVCGRRKYKYGLVVCHDGKIYKYAVDKHDFNPAIARLE